MLHSTLLIVLILSQSALAEIKPALLDEETKNYLFEKAKKHSGITSPQIDIFPPVYYLSRDDMNNTVCPDKPEQCRSLGAVFDDIGYRILILDTLEISTNFKPFDYSFLIHEIVHVLQYRTRGPEIFKDCGTLYETEREAYQAQDNYLKEEGEFFRASIVLRSFSCDEAELSSEYEKSRAAWEERGWTTQ